MKKLFSILLIIFLIGYVPISCYAKNLSGLELRQAETQIYNTSNMYRVMKAAVNTLQDSDFIVEEFEPEIGHIRARKMFKQRYINKGRFAGQSALLALTTSYAVFTWGSTAAYVYAPTRKLTDELHQKNAVVDININVSKFGDNKTKVRIVLVQKILQNAEGFSYSSNAPLKAFRVTNQKIYDEIKNVIFNVTNNFDEDKIIMVSELDRDFSICKKDNLLYENKFQHDNNKNMIKQQNDK